MPQTLKKLKGHIALGLSICPDNNSARVFKFHRWIPHQKIIGLGFFKSGLSPFLELCPFKRVIMKFCNQAISKTIPGSSFKLCQLIEDNE